MHAAELPRGVERIGVADLPADLGALVRDATGGGVLAYQMARSRHLVREHAATRCVPDEGAEVGREVGYADPFYSSRQFSRVHGLSPSDSRVQRTG